MENMVASIYVLDTNDSWRRREARPSSKSQLEESAIEKLILGPIFMKKRAEIELLCELPGVDLKL